MKFVNPPIYQIMTIHSVRVMPKKKPAAITTAVVMR